jgi:hypothetical protein
MLFKRVDFRLRHLPEKIPFHRLLIHRFNMIHGPAPKGGDLKSSIVSLSDDVFTS